MASFFLTSLFNSPLRSCFFLLFLLSSLFFLFLFLSFLLISFPSSLLSFSSSFLFQFLLVISSHLMYLFFFPFLRVCLNVGFTRVRNLSADKQNDYVEEASSDSNSPRLGNRRLRKNTDTSLDSHGRWERSAIDRWWATQVRSVWARGTGARASSWPEWREAPTSRVSVSKHPTSE